MKSNFHYFILLFFGVSSNAQTYTEVYSHDIELSHLGLTNTAIVDINSDGHLDIWTGQFAYLNDGACNYVAAKTEHIETRITTFGDYDNDGYPDALSLEPNSFHLFRNSGPPLYQLVNVDSIANLGYHIPEVDLKDIAWVDINNDGWLDIYVSSYEFPKEDSGIGHPDHLLLNDGHGAFIDISESSGIQEVEKCSRGISILDFDNDGYQDIYVNSYRLEDNVLWHNQGDNTFVNVAIDQGVSGRKIAVHFGHSIASAVGDLDGNGCFDIFVPVTHHLSYPGDPWNHFWLNTCGPDFEFFDFIHHQTLNAEIGSSPALIDFDNDGDLDVFYINLYGRPGARLFLYANDGGVFSDVTKENGLLTKQKALFGLFADLNCDQVLDIYLPRFNKPEALNYFYMSNDSVSNNGVVFMLRGSFENGSNVSAFGSRIKLWVNGETQLKELNYNNGNGYGSMMLPFLHFGLSTNTIIDSIEIYWPSGTKEKHYLLSANEQYFIEELKGIKNTSF